MHSTKRDKTVLMDIDNTELIRLEEILYANGVLTFNRNYYIANSDIEIEEEEYTNFYCQYPTKCRIGRNFFPVALFELLKLAFYYYQLEKNNHHLFILRDPAGIDSTILLDDSLTSNSLLHSVIKKLGLGISPEEIYVFQLADKKRLAEEIGNRLSRTIIDILYIISSVLERVNLIVQTSIIPLVNNEKIVNGNIYTLEYNKGLVSLSDRGNVLEIRYNNIITLSRNKIKVECEKEIEEYEDEDNEEYEGSKEGWKL